MKFASLSIAAVFALAGQTDAQRLFTSRGHQALSKSDPQHEDRHLQQDESMSMMSMAGIAGSLSYGFIPDSGSGTLGSKSGKASKAGKSCKRHIEPKPTKECKEENPYNGLQDLEIIAPDLNPDPIAFDRCIAAYQSSGFNEYDFDNYSKWMDDDTIMMLADTGFWKGVEGVLEYVQLALTPGPCESKPFITNVGAEQGTEGIVPIKAEGNECIVMLTAKVTFQNRCLFGGDVDTIFGSRYSFTIVDDTSAEAAIYMKRMDLYFPPGVIASLATASKTPDYATKLCETMQSSCPNTFENNCYNAPGETTGIEKCVDELLSLPATDDDGPSSNGKSFGCRYIHSILAKTNEKHCGHISFDPEFDPNCYAKCQQAAGITNADMFHPIELGFMAGEAAKFGLPAEQWIYIDEP